MFHHHRQTTYTSPNALNRCPYHNCLFHFSVHISCSLFFIFDSKPPILSVSFGSQLTNTHSPQTSRLGLDFSLATSTPTPLSRNADSANPVFTGILILFVFGFFWMYPYHSSQSLFSCASWFIVQSFRFRSWWCSSTPNKGFLKRPFLSGVPEYTPLIQPLLFFRFHRLILPTYLKPPSPFVWISMRGIIVRSILLNPVLLFASASSAKQFVSC